MTPVYLDETTYWKIMSQAAENNGRVVFDSVGYNRFEIELDAEYAKKEWDEIIDRISKNVDIDHQEARSVVDRYLR